MSGEVYNMVELKEIFEGIVEEKTKITQIEIKKATAVFGQNARTPERQVAVIHTPYGREAHAVPKGIEYVDGKWEVKDKLQAMKSLRNPNSWFSKFYRVYNDFPKEGMEVTVTVNPRGFTVIKV